MGNQRTRKLLGGKVIGAGGFGCIFDPALRCKKSKKRTKGISKLSQINNSNKEWSQLMLIKKYIKKIPNYKKYFLLDNLSKCSPARLTKGDKINLDHCYNLFNLNINEHNINQYLLSLQIINMPYGGISLNYIIINNLLPITTINYILKQILINAILPMNQLHLYHLDVKADNLLYKDNNLHLIDFGEIGISTPKQIIPLSIIENITYILFNRPFSCILFSNLFNLNLHKFLINNNINNIDILISKLDSLEALILEYYLVTEQDTIGHEIYLSQFIFTNIFKLAGIDIQNIENIHLIVRNCIIKYCASVLIQYINFEYKLFHRDKFFSEVYSKNVDIYGFIMCYISFFVKSVQMQETISDIPQWQQINIVNIIIDYCFSNQYATKVINIDELITRFEQVNMPNNYENKVYLEPLESSYLYPMIIKNKKLQKIKKPRKTRKKRKKRKIRKTKK